MIISQVSYRTNGPLVYTSLLLSHIFFLSFVLTDTLTFNKSSILSHSCFCHDFKPYKPGISSDYYVCILNFIEKKKKKKKKLKINSLLL